jgi:hypothetical protein
MGSIGITRSIDGIADDRLSRDYLAELIEHIRGAVERFEGTVTWPPVAGPAPSTFEDSVTSAGERGLARSELRLDFTEANPERPIAVDYILFADGDKLQAGAKVDASLDGDSEPEGVVRAQASSGTENGRAVNSISAHARAEAGGDAGGIDVEIGGGVTGEGLGIEVDLGFFGG